MAETIVIGIFLILLIILQIKERREIIIYAKTSRIKRLLAVVLAIALLVIFWPESLVLQLRLVIVALMIVSVAFIKEGLSKKQLIKIGLLNGELSKFQLIQIEKQGSNNSFVTFYKNKNTSFSMFFDESPKMLQSYFIKNHLQAELLEK